MLYLSLSSLVARAGPDSAKMYSHEQSHWVHFITSWQVSWILFHITSPKLEFQSFLNPQRGLYETLFSCIYTGTKHAEKTIELISTTHVRKINQILLKRWQLWYHTVHHQPRNCYCSCNRLVKLFTNDKSCFQYYAWIESLAVFLLKRTSYQWHHRIYFLVLFFLFCLHFWVHFLIFSPTSLAQHQAEFSHAVG